MNPALKTVWINPKSDPARDAPAVFADRDGTLIKHVDYLSDPERVELLPGVRSAIKSLLSAGSAIFLFTNQSGVGRGYYSLKDVALCHEAMFQQIGIDVEQLAGYCIAPGAPDGDDPYRKPSPKFIIEALRHFKLRESQSHMIGDTAVDLETAANASISGWLVGNGKPQAVEAHRSGNLQYPYLFRDSFADCVKSILAEKL